MFSIFLKYLNNKGDIDEKYEWKQSMDDSGLDKTLRSDLADNLS